MLKASDKVGEGGGFCKPLKTNFRAASLPEQLSE